ncbi:MAG: hypothetical protein GYA24_00295 [Candidatus Lokiarchaeota archaeon]|nr:hypothetical protein [Candidatus Lokiarchaeota archaeon]
MAAQGSPFVDLNEIDVQPVYKTQRLMFYTVENQAYQIAIGMANRLQDRAAVELFARMAGEDRDTWSDAEGETIECLVDKAQVGRAEEWVLSRLIKKRGADVFRDALKTTGTPFTSISHSTKAVAVLFSDVPAGIDHEVIEARDASWASRMDPDREAIPLGNFLGTWRQLTTDCLQTITWAAKEASMKAWAFNRLGLLPGIKIDGRGTMITTRAVTNEKKEIRCQILLHVDLTGVLAIALPVTS